MSLKHFALLLFPFLLSASPQKPPSLPPVDQWKQLDAEETLDSLKAKAEKGDPQACFFLGNFYYRGTDEVPQDRAKALQLWLRGADKGHVSCLFNAGNAYLLGQGTPQDFQKAIHFLDKAAHKQHSKAILKLCDLYTRGAKGVEPNPEKVKYYIALKPKAVLDRKDRKRTAPAEAAPKAPAK